MSCPSSRRSACGGRLRAPAGIIQAASHALWRGLDPEPTAASTGCYMRVSKADGSQVTDLQRDALLAAGVDARQLYEDITSGKPDDRPGLVACLKALRPGDTLVFWKLDRLGPVGSSHRSPPRSPERTGRSTRTNPLRRSRDVSPMAPTIGGSVGALSSRPLRAVKSKWKDADFSLKCGSRLRYCRGATPLLLSRNTTDPDLW
jgi:hypothetical protein